MDAKGRPTRLEDIITPEQLIAIMEAPIDMGDDIEKVKEMFRTSDELSRGIRTAIHKFTHDRSFAIMMMSFRTDPDKIVCAYMQALVTSIDKAIKQKAECESLREMVDG